MSGLLKRAHELWSVPAVLRCFDVVTDVVVMMLLS